MIHRINGLAGFRKMSEPGFWELKDSQDYKVILKIL
jgi:hypothetical protein